MIPRHFLYQSCIFLFACILLVARCQSALCQPETGTSVRQAARHPQHDYPPEHVLSLEYTGALFGYYRIEANRGSVLGGMTKSLPAVEEFVGYRKVDSRLLLGMGDNFAPEFGAAIQLEGLGDCRQPVEWYNKNKYHRDEPPALQYKLSGWVASHAHCDNVTNFLMRAGYRAVVPGREDFLYSAPWLQQIAILLRSEEKKKEINPNEEHTLNLLAANLRVKDAHHPKSCPLLLSPDAVPPPSDQEEKPIDPKTDAGKTQCVKSEGEDAPEAQDWVERLDTIFKYPQVNDRLRKEVEKSAIVRRQLLMNQTSMVLAALQYSISKSVPGTQNDKEKFDSTIKSLKRLTQEDGYTIRGLTVFPNDQLLSAVAGFKVEWPFPSQLLAARDVQIASQALRSLFDQIGLLNKTTPSGRTAYDLTYSEVQREAIRNLLLRDIAIEEREVGFAFADHRVQNVIATRTLLVGVVGRETMDAVSPSNLTVGNEKERVSILDPRRTTEILIRAAALLSKDQNQPIANTIVMAQMPHTEAEELGAHLKVDLMRLPNAIDEPYKVDLILSEAQAEHASPVFDTEYRGAEMIPVLTPHPAFDRTRPGLVQPLSAVQIRSLGQGRHIFNRTSTRMMGTSGCPQSTLALLEIELTDKTGVPVQLATEPCSQNTGTENTAAENIPNTPFDKPSAIAFLLHELQASSHADVVFLERRDLYLDEVPKEYSEYDDFCPPHLDMPHGELSPLARQREEETPRLLMKSNTDASVKRCRLHVALDRILWKGDFSQRVMVTGKDLKGALQAAGDQVLAQRSLAARDTTDQWLVTFGVVTNDATNLARLESSADRFAIPWSEECGTSQKQKEPQYCINGSTIADDAGYWVSTSDHIANDTSIYKMLEPTMASYHQQKWVKLIYSTSHEAPYTSEGMFMTDEVATRLDDETAEKVKPYITTSSLEHDPKVVQHLQQDRSLIHLDYGRLVAGFSIRHPDGGNATSADLQGVTDSRASQAGQQELDLESVNRFSSDMSANPKGLSFSLGAQSDAEYDRSVLGNLTGKPINASYAVNNITVGGFIQKRLPFFHDAKTTGGDWASRELPRTLFVLYPYQYQRQVTGNYVFINFTSGSQELTVHAPLVTGHAYKAGLRHELTSGRKWAFDRGSYAESGWEYVVQDNVARSITLTTGSTGLTKTCYANQRQTLAQCFTGFTIDATTKPSPPDVVSQTTTGMYWDIHLQRTLPKGGDAANAKINFTIDTKGDFFGGRKSSLATQTRYAFPVTAAINFPVLRNLALSPTYSAFLFQNQVSQQSILVNTFSISAKWFYDRDSAVPFGRMFLFKGPASQDQTKAAKIK